MRKNGGSTRLRGAKMAGAFIHELTCSPCDLGTREAYSWRATATRTPAEGAGGPSLCGYVQRATDGCTLSERRVASGRPPDARRARGRSHNVIYSAEHRRTCGGPLVQRPMMNISGAQWWRE